ncbi:16311_t:CDS:2, partial [Racocetra fulgida]
GTKAVPEAKSALRFLDGENKLKKKIPFILLTNGGGVTEIKKAEELTHSPMRQLVPMFKDSEVLIIGGADLQIILDVLQSKDGYFETSSSPQELLTRNFPLYFSNPDIIWSNECLIPRMAQGSFRLCLEHLYE